MIPSLYSFQPDGIGCSGRWMPCPLLQPRAPRLTADVKQVCEEEGLLVEVLYGEDDRAIQAAPERLLGATLVCDE